MLEHLFTRHKHHLVELHCSNRLQGAESQYNHQYSLPISLARYLTACEPEIVRTLRALREHHLGLEDDRAVEGICLQGTFTVPRFLRPQPFPWAAGTGYARLFKPTRTWSATVFPEEDRRNATSSSLQVRDPCKRELGMTMIPTLQMRKMSLRKARGPSMNLMVIKVKLRFKPKPNLLH